MKTRIKTLALVSAVSVCTLQHLSADVVGVDLGTANPPATLGGNTMSPYDPGSIGGAFATTIGVGWATWGQGYAGTVYAVIPNNPLTLTLNPGTTAVYFYEEPNQSANFDMTATDSSGVSVTTLVNGNAGSAGVGFYETLSGDSLSKITVTCTDPYGFAIGEFGISGDGGGFVAQITPPGNVPETGRTLIFLAMGLAGLFAYSRLARTAAA